MWLYSRTGVYTKHCQLCIGQPHHLPQSACKQPITEFRSGFGNYTLTKKRSVVVSLQLWKRLRFLAIVFENVVCFDTFSCKCLPFKSVYAGTFALVCYANVPV